jgi:hypothetical protein
LEALKLWAILRGLPTKSGSFSNVGDVRENESFSYAVYLKKQLVIEETKLGSVSTVKSICEILIPFSKLNPR